MKNQTRVRTTRTAHAPHTHIIVKTNNVQSGLAGTVGGFLALGSDAEEKVRDGAAAPTETRSVIPACRRPADQPTNKKKGQVSRTRIDSRRVRVGHYPG
jgi:hypothetical protein